MAHSTKDVRLCSLGGMGGAGDWGMWVGETAQERGLSCSGQALYRARGEIDSEDSLMGSKLAPCWIMGNREVRAQSERTWGFQWKGALERHPQPRGC